MVPWLVRLANQPVSLPLGAAEGETSNLNAVRHADQARKLSPRCLCLFFSLPRVETSDEKDKGIGVAALLWVTIKVEAIPPTVSLQRCQLSDHPLPKNIYIMRFHSISPTAVLLLFGTLASVGNCNGRENDQVIAALLHLGPAATSFCSSFLCIPKKTITAATVTPVVYVSLTLPVWINR